MKVLNRLLGLLIAAALIAGAVVLIIEVAAAQFERGPVIVDWRAWEQSLRTTSWADAQPVLIAALVVAFALLVFELAPRRPSTLPVTHEPNLDVTVRRRFLERHAAQRVDSVDGVSGARVRWRRRRIDVRAVTRRVDPRGLTQEIRQVVEDELHRLALAQPPPVQVHVRSLR